MTAIDRTRLRRLLERERAAYAAANPRSAAANAAAAPFLFGGVPMTWMNKAAGGFPLHLATARGARVTDADGHEYVDFALGDTGAMAGHSPPATVAAVTRRIGELGGITAMMPTADAAWVGEELGRRFGLPLWSFTLTATDANRWAIRIAREVTRRPKILVNAYCYHGSVDETLAVTGPDGAAPREGNVGAPVPVHMTTRVAEFNDVEMLERELAHGDVAAVLMEPALTNIGIVLPEPGYLEAVRDAHARARHAADQRRDAHVLGRPRRRHRRIRPRARRAHDRQGDRGRRARRRVRPHARGRGADRRAGAGRPDRRRRRRRHAGRQRALARRHPRDPRGGPHAGSVHGDDGARDALRRRRHRGDRALRPAVVGRPARRPRRVPLRLAGAARRHRVGGRRRRGARGLPARPPRQPRDPHHPVPQHGAHVPGHDGRRRRPPHRGLHRERSPS